MTLSRQPPVFTACQMEVHPTIYDWAETPKLSFAFVCETRGSKRHAGRAYSYLIHDYLYIHEGSITCHQGRRVMRQVQKQLQHVYFSSVFLDQVDVND